jgi:putative membrane protein
MPENQAYPAVSEIPGGARWAEYPHLLWRGVSMGMAEVIPGVSGGTLAYITGILGRMVDAIHSVDAEAARMALSLRFRELLTHVHWRFLLMLFSSQMLGILFFTRVVSLPLLLREYPEPVLGLFFGLVSGSIIILARSGGIPSRHGILFYLLGGLIGASVVAGVRTETPETPWFVFLCGSIAICAWVLPGVSGSFVLLLMKKYNYIWSALTLHNDQSFFWNLLNVVVPFAMGAGLGLAVFSRLLSWVMHRHPKPATQVMNGILIASTWVIFPFQNARYEMVASGKSKLVGTSPYLPGPERLFTAYGILTIGLMISGFVLILWIDAVARKKRAE